MGKIIGVNDMWYPREGDPADPVNIKVVLVEGQIGDYAAYAGSGSDSFVAAQGNKIPFEEANAHFCGQLVKEKYRS